MKFGMGGIILGERRGLLFSEPEGGWGRIFFHASLANSFNKCHKNDVFIKTLTIEFEEIKYNLEGGGVNLFLGIHTRGKGVGVFFIGLLNKHFRSPPLPVLNGHSLTWDKMINFLFNTPKSQPLVKKGCQSADMWHRVNVWITARITSESA